MFKAVLSDESNSSLSAAAGASAGKGGQPTPAEVEVAASEYSIGADDILQVNLNWTNKVFVKEFLLTLET